MRRLLFVGQNVTFPKLVRAPPLTQHMISNRIHLERAIARGREYVRTESATHADDDLRARIGSLSRPGSSLSLQSERSEPSDVESVDARERTTPRRRTPRKRPQDLRKGLAVGDSSVLETYSPEWFQFLHAADSPMAGTPYESGAEDDAPRSMSVRRALTMPAEPHAWRRRGSMHADGTLTALAPADDAWEAEGEPEASEREALARNDGVQYDVDREHNARGDGVDVDRTDAPSDS